MNLNKKISSLLNENKKLVENFTYLGLIQVFNLLLPLLTYPYLIHVLQIEIFGSIVFAQNLISYFTIVINFGFNISGAKEVSIYRNDKSKITEIVSSIIIIKFIFWILALILLISSLLVLNLRREDFLLYIFSFSICFQELLFPQWYFQGVEKMKFTTIINLIIRLIFLVMIFLFVKEKSDYLLVPLFSGIGALIGGLISLYIIFFREKVRFKFQNINILILYLKSSFALFASDIVISLKDKLNVFFIGLFLGMKDVAIYDLGMKIVGLILQLVNIANNAIYPKVAVQKDMNFVKKITKYTFYVVCFLVFIIQIFINNILHLFNQDLSEAIIPIRILLLSPIIFSISFPMAHNCLVVFGKYKLLLIGMIITSILYLMLIYIGYLFQILDSIISFAIITVLVYFIELIYRYFIIKKNMYETIM
jgi:PST family polysaccharide transporter